MDLQNIYFEDFYDKMDEIECSITTIAKIVEIKELSHPTGTGRRRNNCVYI